MSAFEKYQQGLLGGQAFGHGTEKGNESRFTKVSTEDDYCVKALTLVGNYVLSKLEKSDPPVEFQVFAVWFCKTLKNWKALISTTLPDGMYYEVTHNGEKNETYIDAYKKFDNVCIPD